MTSEYFGLLTTLRHSQKAQDDVTEITGYSYDTVRHDSWVAGEFRFGRRRPNSGIPFAIFRELAPRRSVTLHGSRGRCSAIFYPADHPQLQT
jgi:hypothetical protein